MENKNMKNTGSLIMVLLILIILGCKCQSDLFDFDKKSTSENEVTNTELTNSDESNNSKENSLSNTGNETPATNTMSENRPDTPPTSSNTDSSAPTVMGGILNSRATSLPLPEYPAAAKAVKAQGTVNVNIIVDTSGNVVFAQAVDGHPLLRAAAEKAARQAKFPPLGVNGKPVTVKGGLTYTFTL